MSGKQRSKLGRTMTHGAPRTGNETLDALAQCIEAQESLTRAQELSRKWEEHRRDAVRRAFAEGIDAGQIADALKVSRTKVYQLVGSVRALKVKGL